VAPPAYLLATKLEAFRSRGKDDLYGSRDFEDIIALIDGREAPDREDRGTVVASCCSRFQIPEYGRHPGYSDLTMLKPQDIVVLLKLSGEVGEWTFGSVSRDLGVSPSSIHRSLERAAQSGLYDPERKRVHHEALAEFLVHGIQYAFPGEMGGEARGIPTAWGAMPLSKQFADRGSPPVWPHPDGRVRGIALKPLHRSVPGAAQADAELGQMLALVDAIRIGGSRERKLAAGHLERRLREAGYPAPVSNAPMPPGATSDGLNSRILVIGCGFIGSNIVEELVDRSRPPVVLSRSRPVPAVADLISASDLHVGDAADPKALERALEGVGHVVFSSGGLLPVASEQDPERDARLTLGPVRAVLEALRSRPGVALTYLSSGGTVYGEPARVPVPEDAPTAPIGAYGRLHLACEAEVLAHNREHGTFVRILRCASVYGPHQNPDRGQGVVVTFLHRIQTGAPVELYGAGETERDYVYAGDVARVVAELIDRKDGPEILNLGSGTGTALRDVLALAERAIGRAAIKVEHPARDFEVHRIVLDIQRLQRLMEFEPLPLERGIALTHRWLVSGTPERV
jgi:UDP-glucose 4-epimerase